MRKIHMPSAVSAGLLVAFLAAFVLLGYGYGVSRAAASVRADGATVTAATGPIVCAFNMSWDGTGCR